MLAYNVFFFSKKEIIQGFKDVSAERKKEGKEKRKKREEKKKGGESENGRKARDGYVCFGIIDNSESQVAFKTNMGMVGNDRSRGGDEGLFNGWWRMVVQ